MHTSLLLALAQATATSAGQQLSGATEKMTRPARELHVGNLPIGMGAAQLFELMGKAMQQYGMGVNTPATPMCHLRFGGDGHYAFCEMRTVEVRRGTQLAACTLALEGAERVQ